MISKFLNNQTEYKDWLKNNELGYVFNFFEGRDSSCNLIHMSNCTILRRKSDDGSRTVHEKVCSSDLKELLAEATKLRGSLKEWTLCKICFPDE